MLGAIAGDIIGSVYEHRPIKTKEFPLFGPHSRFTDDSVLTIAVAEAILLRDSYETTVRRYGRLYPHAGYGGSFNGWLLSDTPEPYNSWGNGSAMRVSSVGFAYNDEQTVLREARRSAEITHNHTEGIKGAQATALAVFLAKIGADKTSIRDRIQELFDYDLTRTVDSIRPDYVFDISCQGTVPEAIVAFLDSSSFQDAIRNAVSLGGDSDTLACIAGGIAEAFYREIPDSILYQVRTRLTEGLWDTAHSFYQQYGIDEIVQQLDRLGDP